MRVVKIVGIAVGAFFGLVIVAGIIAALMFDPNDYKEYVQEFVEERTGRSLAIHDDIELSVFPWLAVETGRVELGNAPGFGPEPFVSTERVSARVRLLPLLLRREFEIGTVRLDGLELDLAVAADGTTNWADLAGTESEAAGAPAAAPDTTETNPLSGLAVEGIELRGARITWRENDAPRFIVSELALSTGTVSTAEPIDIEVAFDMLDVASQRTIRLEATTEATLQSSGGLRAGTSSIDFRIADGSGNVDAQGNAVIDSLEFVPGERLRSGAVQLRNTMPSPLLGGATFASELGWTSLDVELAELDFAIENLRASANGVEAQWQLIGENLAGDDGLLRGSLVVNDAPAAAALELAGITLPEDIDVAALGAFSASSGFVLGIAAQDIQLSNLELAMLGIDVRVQQAAMSGENLTAQIDITPFRPNAALRRVLAPYLPEGITLEPLGTLAFSARVAGTPSDLGVTGMSLSALGAQLTGQLRLVQAAAGLRVNGDIATNRFAPDELFAVAGALMPESVTRTAAGTLAVSGRFAWNAADGSLQLDGLGVEAFGMRGNGSLAARGIGRGGEFTGRVQLEEFNPRTLLERFSLAVPQTSDETALRRASVATSFQVSPTSASFDDLLVRLDDSRMTGSFVVTSFDNPLYRFSLTADQLDVDRYLPPQAPPGADDAPADGERRAGDIALSGEALSAVNVDADVTVGQLGLAGMDFSNVTTSLVVGGGRMLLDSAHADLYGGSFDGRFHVDAASAVPTMLLQGRAANLSLTPLITALAGSASFSGTGNFDIDLRGRGPTVTDNLRSAGGTMGFALNNGAIEGFNIDKTLCRAFNRARGNAAPTNVPDRTPYEVISGTATVTDGIAASSDLRAVAGSAEVRGSGTLALADQVVDYNFEARVARPVQIQGCQEMERIVGHDFPLVMRGPLTAPEITPDYSEVIRRVLEYQLRESIRDRLLEGILN